MPSIKLPALLISHDNLLRISTLVAARTGLVFSDKRQHTLEEACVDGAQHIGCDVAQYLDALEGAKTDSPAWERLIQAITISETYFFRDVEQMRALRATILPALIASHQADRTLRIWSAGCATGEEAYTLAILLQQLIPDIQHWKITLLATDLNKQALQQARTACYRQWSFRQTEPGVRDTYFTPCAHEPHEGDLYALDPAIRRMVTFAYLNLAEESFPSATNFTADLDLILCRNVIIYLPHDVTRGAINRFQRCLVPGGWLIVGASEYHPDMYAQFEMMHIGNAVAYRNGDGASAFKTLPMLSPAAELILDPQADANPASLAVAKALQQIAAPGDCANCRYSFIAHNNTGGNDALDNLPSPEDCLRHNPRCVRALCQMAGRAADRGRLLEALQWARQAIETDPLYAESHYVLGLVHDELGEVDKALACMRKALYLDPTFVLAHYAISALYQRTGQLSEAERHRVIAIRNAGTQNGNNSTTFISRTPVI